MERGLTCCLVIGLGGLFAVPAMGAKSNPQVQEAKAEVYRLWNVDSMIQQAADNVARRYNLSPEQREKTRQMMQAGVTKFLEQNEEAIWPLVRDLARQQLTGAPPDPETAKHIGEAALPLVEKAKQAIYKANEDWGQILSPEQKQLHDFDLREMKGQFEEINRNFEGYKDGNLVPNPMFPQSPSKADEPPRPPRPSNVYRPSKRLEDAWDKYVQDFIAKYELDPGQKLSAESYLREVKQRAADHRTSRVKEYADVAKRLRESYATGDLKKRATAERDEKALNKPINDLFDELKRRLDGIPTPAQKKKYEDALKAKQSRIPRPGGPKAESATTQPKPPAAATQPKGPPATTQPQTQPATMPSKPEPQTTPPQETGPTRS
jgi:hypothetical protein